MIATPYELIDMTSENRVRQIYKVVSGETTKYYEITIDIDGVIDTNDVTAEMGE